MVFFKEPFIMILGLYTAWFISSFRTMPSRRKEFNLLNSLPINDRRICNYFMGRDFFQNAWVPGLTIFLYLSLLSVTPVSHLIRLSLLTLLIYFIFIVLKVSLHLLIAVKRKGFEVYKYPDQNNPILMILNITGFALSQLVFILNPQLSSGTFFVIFMIFLSSICLSLLMLAHKFFNRWKNGNLVFRIKADSTKEMISSEYSGSNLFQKYPKFHPILIKNILKIIKGKNRLSLLLTVVFISFAYLVSLNNERLEDSIAVLFGILCFYTFLFSYRAINQFTSNNESPELIYLLPLKKWDLYVYHFVPLWLWIAIVALLCTILILVSCSSLALAGIFLLKSMAAGFIFLQGALNYTLGSYPNNKKAKKHFLYWCVSMLVLSAVFYIYAIIVIILMVIISFFPLRKMKLYKVS